MIKRERQRERERERVRKREIIQERAFTGRDCAYEIVVEECERGGISIERQLGSLSQNKKLTRINSE